MAQGEEAKLRAGADAAAPRAAGGPGGMRRRAASWKARLGEKLWDERRERTPGPRRYLWRGAQVIWLAARGYFDHQDQLRANALTYSAFLSFIPLLALVFSILKGLGYQETIANEILGTVTATSGTETEGIVRATQNTLDFINRTRVGALTGLGVIGLFYVTVFMLRNLELAMNTIWEAKRSRTIKQILGEYVSLILIAPLLLAFGAATLQLIRVPQTFPFAGFVDDVILWPIVTVMPYVAIFSVFVFAYYYMPHVRVYWVSALVGGIVGGYLWILAQHVYVRVTLVFIEERYNAIYKSFAWIFILLIWVNISWSILLFGAELACSHQRLDDLRRARRRWSGAPADLEALALRLAALLARPMQAPLGEPVEPLTIVAASDALLLPPAPIERTLLLFEKAGLAHRDAATEGWLLSRSAEAIHALDLILLARHGGLDDAGGDNVGEAGPFDAARDAFAREIESMTLRDLVALPIERIRIP